MKPLRFEIPLTTPSVANLREHWAKKAARVKRQRNAVRLLCPPWTGGPVLVVRLTRVGPRELDSDNLAAALKAPQDAIASWLRIDDGSPLVRWERSQAKGEPNLVVEVEAA